MIYPRNYSLMKFCIVLLYLLSINVLSAKSQEVERIGWDFGNFTIVFPEYLKYHEEDEYNKQEGKSFYRNEDWSFFCLICFFVLDEDYEQRENLRKEVAYMGLDLDSLETFVITTGKDYPILCTYDYFINKEEDIRTDLYGVFPDYDHDVGILFYLRRISKEEDLSSLLKILSTFRVKE